LGLVEEEEIDNKTLADIIHIEGVELNELEKESINYLSVKLSLYNFHSFPFTSNTPKIQVYLEDRMYYIEIIDGEIYIKEGETREGYY